MYCNAMQSATSVQVENLMTSSLGDLDVSNEIFYEALAQGRHARDINRSVFERLLAMEDFEHFKKIMVRRNLELQLEELQEYRAIAASVGGKLLGVGVGWLEVGVG
jgi:hypothetical protein